VLVRRSAGCLALATALAACGGEKTTAPPVTASSVSIAPDNPSLSVGATIALTATARDAAGTVLTGRTVAWTTSRPEVATVNATTGLVTAVGPGLAFVTATIDQKFDRVLVTVIPPVASVQITARRVTIGASGGTSQLTATTRDATGTTLTGRAVTWTSSDETKARVSQAGLVTGVGVGRVTITATSEGVPGTITIDVVDVPPPQITVISPATLTPGATVTIDGAHFDTNPADLDVTIAGLLVPVTAATPTELTVQLPAFVPCQPTQNTTVSVTGVGGAATRAHPLKVAQQRSVAVGEMLLLGGVDLRCNELPQTSARYALAVINASRSPSTIVGFEFRGQTAGASASAAPVAAATPSLTWAGAGGYSAALVSPFRRTALALHVREHMAHLERERELVRRLGHPTRAARQAAAHMQARETTALSQRSAAPVPLEVGQTTTLKIRTSDVNCTDFRNVPARVVYVGSKSVVLESTDAPLAKTMDADYVALGKEYDDVMHGVLTQYFGDPLAYDASTDKNGKIVMLFTKAVNDRAAGLMGFVTACDLWPAYDPRTTASNEAEIFYARVPTSTETNYRNINTRVGWMHNMRATVVHEAKHIVSFAERFATPEEALPEESWLEEGTAQAAVEFWGRATYYAGKAPWKGNATYENTMRCDNRPADPACGGQPSIITDHFLFLFGYYENIEAKSYFSEARSDATVYGSGWLLARWAADHYASDEAAFFQALTRSWTQTGLANIEARTGREFGGLHPDFTADVGTLLGGAAAYVELSGAPSGPQILDLRGPGGIALSAETPLRLAILRVQ
jgi:hypothetical protein